MKTINIEKFKLVSSNEVKIQYVERVTNDQGERVSIDITETRRYFVHPDLQLALSKLVPHLIAICELNDYYSVIENPSLQVGFEVSGVSFGGSDEYRGAVIVGKKTLKSERVLNLVSPFCSFESENPFYDHESEFYEHCSELEKEIILYIQGKHAPNPQLELPLEPVKVLPTPEILEQ
jgi:hypothetical protein